MSVLAGYTSFGMTYKDFHVRQFYVLEMIGNCGSYTLVSITRKSQSHFYELTQDILSLRKHLLVLDKNEG